MTKKIKRTENFEIVLEIKTADFIRPPRDAQRNALLNNALNEFSDNLHALDKLAVRFRTRKTSDRVRRPNTKNSFR